MNLRVLVDDIETYFFKDEKKCCHRITNNSYGGLTLVLQTESENIHKYKLATKFGINFFKKIEDLEKPRIDAESNCIKMEAIEIFCLQDDQNKIILMDYNEKCNKDIKDDILINNAYINGNLYIVLIINDKFVHNNIKDVNTPVSKTVLNKISFVIETCIEHIVCNDKKYQEEVYMALLCYFAMKFFSNIDNLKIEIEKISKKSMLFIPERRVNKYLELFMARYNDLKDEEYLEALYNGYLW